MEIGNEYSCGALPTSALECIPGPKHPWGQNGQVKEHGQNILLILYNSWLGIQVMSQSLLEGVSVTVMVMFRKIICT